MNRIKELRIIKGITQTELGKQVGVNQSAIGKYEREELQPNLETLQKLAIYFDTTIDYLIGFTDDFDVVGENNQSGLSSKEQTLLKYFNLLEDDEKDKILKDCEYFVNKRTSY